MYVCVCNGITERQIRAYVAERGTCSLDELKCELGVATQCGRCEESARQCLDCEDPQPCELEATA